MVIKMNFKSLLIVFLMACALFGGVATAVKANVKDKKVIETLSITTSDKMTYRFKIEIADTESERRHGLMNRTNLKKNEGMLFVFDEVSFQEFWMKDTLISLDILFIDEKGRITNIVEQAKPNDLTPLPSGGPVRAALEILGGQSAKLGIKKGDLVKYNLFTK